MTNSSSVQVYELKSVDEQLGDLPKGLSFFDPILHHEAKEALEAEGEVYVSQSSDGHNNGLFIYDGYETTGTIFTKSREVFDHFYLLKPSSYIFSEYEVAEHPNCQNSKQNRWYGVDDDCRRISKVPRSLR